jgi:hypothetical protein
MKLDSPPQWGSVPHAEGIILWIRANLPFAADRILQLARERYHSICSVCAA